MKKIIFFGYILVYIVLFSACSSNTPGKAAKKYINYIRTGNYDKFIDGISINQYTTVEEMQNEKMMYVALMKEKGEKEIKRKGGIKDIEVISEKISLDGKKAKVVLQQTYGNEEIDKDTINMIFQNGKWKISLGK